MIIILRGVVISSKFIYKNEGIKGFWRGTDTMMLKLMISSSIFYSFLQEFQHLFSQANSPLKSEKLIDFSSAFMARILSALLTNPIQVVRTRVEVVGFNEYRNPVDGLRKVYQLEGVRGFVSGGLSTIMREGPFSGIYYLIYKSMKSHTQVQKT